MRFCVEHRFDAPPSEVAALLVAPAFYEDLRLPDVGPAEVVAHGSADGSGDARVVVRYEYTGSLDPLARRVLGRARLTWTQELRLHEEKEGSAFTGALEVHADASSRFLHGRARVVLERDGASATRRIVDGELVVPLPGVGALAERKIVPGVVARLDAEAAALASRIGGAR